MPSFRDYFEDHIEYPSKVVANPLPMNTIWYYISNTFLNGFINYVEILDAFLLNRYRSMDEVLEDLPSHKASDGTSYGWKWVNTPNMTKREAFNLFTQKDRVYHTNIHTFQDDVLMLCKGADFDPEEDDKPTYIFFWFDCDSSDCCIGRFQTEDTEEQVRANFRKYVRSVQVDNNLPEPEPEVEIPLHFFQGWLKF